jgi:hypothetical protein
MSDFFIYFFQNKIRNIDGLTHNDILNYDNKKLEDKHNYIQYLFPLPVKSKYNPDAPVINQIFINEAINNMEIRKNIIKSFLRMLNFYGYSYSVKPFDIIDKGETKQWLTKQNHNYLRITRILKFLMLVKMDLLAYKFVEQLCKLNESGKIDKKSFNVWIKTIKIGD